MAHRSNLYRFLYRGYVHLQHRATWIPSQPLGCRSLRGIGSSTARGNSCAARRNLSSKLWWSGVRPWALQLSAGDVAGASAPESGWRRREGGPWLSAVLLSALGVVAAITQSRPAGAEAVPWLRPWASGSAPSEGSAVVGAELKGEGSGEDAELKPAVGLPPALLQELRELLGEERVVVDEEEREVHGKPYSSYHAIATIPDAVVYPKSTEEVVSIVKACGNFKVPIVPYGGATSLEGHILAPQRGVSLDFGNMQAIKSFNASDMDVTVEPGIGWMDLNEQLKPHGFFFPLDPGPGATVGGMAATRCSGSLAVRYGTMRDNVISMKAVLANGDVIKTSARSRKSAAGYDLTRLLIGSEGTLAVITEVTLRLQRLPEASAVAMCTFPSVKAAADASIATMQSGIQVSRCELLDEVMVRGLNLATGRGLHEKPTLMYEFIGTEASVHEQADRVQKIVQANGGTHFVFAHDAEEKARLWQARKEALWAAMTQLRPGAEAMITDVCVPLSRLADCIAATKEEIDKSFLLSPIVAHAGDGNFHLVILFDPSDPIETAEAHRINHNTVHRALAMDGTCTGEHGVGVGKMKYLPLELGSEAVTAMAAIKKALDPMNIMNPGKVIPREYCS